MTRRAPRLLAVLAVLLLSGGAPAWGDDDGDDGGGGGAGAGGAGGGGGGGGPGSSGDGAGRSAADRGGLGPNPGRIPMPPSWQRALDNLFGVTPAPAPARAAPPRAEIVALGIPPAALGPLRAQGFAVVAERTPVGLVRLRGPAGLTEAQAFARLRAAAPAAVVDRNHRYRLAGEVEAEAEAPAAAPGCASPSGLIALIDTGVDPRHPALAGRIERQEVLRGPGRRASRTTHGTAVAARLAAAVPGPRIAVLDAFHLGPDGDAADAYDLAAAVARAGEIGAEIATVSVVGPANAVLDRLGREAAARGTVFVAAAGNDGPRAAPLYPAAYGWTVAVTAVDGAGRPWPRAAAGPHITFAAVGVDVPIAQGAQARPRRWSGTSFAAPVVSATLAMVPGSGAARIEALAALARDAGTPGRDPVYGWGVVEPRPCAPTTLVSGSDRAADR
ncbi:S8 family serine peptidase [Roseomonas fluvialis]|uniref:Protease n=1 Tax=Roseomonas fluvialis TaxID=1750527 RepID=A0ABM7Y8Y8_9PROT|nr:S8 family serine peptidase [Roseomonas fluvialis]BDG75014.1 protease [Roseomonas fluvialis]